MLEVGEGDEQAHTTHATVDGCATSKEAVKSMRKKRLQPKKSTYTPFSRPSLLRNVSNRYTFPTFFYD
jgi:hypothetical protein